MNIDTQKETAGLPEAAAAMIAGAADSLAQLLSASVSFRLSNVRDDGSPAPGVATGSVSVDVTFGGALAGTSRLVLSATDAEAIVAAMGTSDENSTVDLNEERAMSALAEGIGRLTAGAALALSGGLGEQVVLSPQTISTNPGPPREDTNSVIISYESEIAGQAGSGILWEIDRDLAHDLAGRWAAGTPLTSADDAPPTGTPAPSATPTPVPPGAAGGVLNSVELDVAVELGNVALTIGELLHLGEGSVVTLTQSVGDDVVMLANGTPVASGEVVVVDGTLGFRVSALITDTQGA